MSFERYNFAANFKNINDMKKKVISLIAVWAALSVCLYGATFAGTSTNVKIACGIAFAMVYCGMILIPYFIAKRKGSKESLGGYLMSLLNNE